MLRSRKSTITRVLQDLELPKHEAVLYTQMLSYPANTVQELTTRTPFPRTMLYYVLRGLIEKGLVTAKKQKRRTVYIAESPERLYDLLAEKEREFDRERDAIAKLIPTLKHRYLLSGKRPTVRIFDGIDEYRKALEDSIVSVPEEIYSFEVLQPGKPALQIRADHEKRRVHKKIRKNILFFEDKDALRELSTRPYNDFTEYRGIHPSMFVPFEADVALYAGKILYTSYYDEHEPAAILIEDQALYRMQKSFFDSLWRMGKDRTLECSK